MAVDDLHNSSTADHHQGRNHHLYLGVLGSLHSRTYIDDASHKDSGTYEHDVAIFKPKRAQVYFTINDRKLFPIISAAFEF